MIPVSPQSAHLLLSPISLKMEFLDSVFDLHHSILFDPKFVVLQLLVLVQVFLLDVF